MTAPELARAHWSELPPSPLGPRADPVLAWTGNELLELGGTSNGVIQRDGAAFDTGTRHWGTIARAPDSVGLSGAVSVWTGPVSQQLFVASGKVAGLYNPFTNRWMTTDLPAPMTGLRLTTAVWTGHEVILAAISGPAATPRLAVTAYNTADRRWQMITPRLPVRHPVRAVTLVATWHRVILWSMWSRTAHTANGRTTRSGIDVQVLRHSQWITMTSHWPQHQAVQGAAFANFLILIPPGQAWCGDCPEPSAEPPPRFADPASLALTDIPGSHAATEPLSPTPIWLYNGSTVLAASEYGHSKAAPDGHLGNLAAYDRFRHRWHPLPRAPDAPSLAAAPILAEQQLVVLTLGGDLLSLGQRP